jgi:hypothetical protein
MAQAARKSPISSYSRSTSFSRILRPQVRSHIDPAAHADSDPTEESPFLVLSACSNSGNRFSFTASCRIPVETIGAFNLRYGSIEPCPRVGTQRRASGAQ